MEREYGLYAHPAAVEARESYLRLLRQGRGDGEIVAALSEQAKSLRGTEEEPFFWLGWAETSFRRGKLTPEVKTVALRLIDREAGLAVSARKPGGETRWRATLQRLRALLISPQPASPPAKAKRDLPRDPWALGEVYALALRAGGYLALQKTGADELFMHIAAFDGLFPQIPTLETLEGLRYLPWENPRPHLPLAVSVRLYLVSFNEYPADRLHRLGALPVGPIAEVAGEYLSWTSLERLAPLLHRRWVGESYYLEPGLARYTAPALL